jgi:hypothetical protein
MRKMALILSAVFWVAPTFAAPMEQVACLIPAMGQSDWGKLASATAAGNPHSLPALQEKLTTEVTDCVVRHGWSAVDVSNAMRFAMMDAFARLSAAKLTPDALKIADEHFALHADEYIPMDEFMTTKLDAVIESLVAEGMSADDQPSLNSASVYIGFKVKQRQFWNDFVQGVVRDTGPGRG